VRVLVFHGYLLRGTGSNVYNAELAAALVDLGHEVHLICQEPHASELEFVGEVGDWDDGQLRLTRIRELPCTVYRPDIGGLLPVYVPDRYEGVEARPFQELTDAELAAYLGANVRAVSEVVSRARIDMALANHLVMGPAILARALAGTGIPYAAKLHGSALEYTVKPYPRFRPYALEGIAPARTVLVGSRRDAENLWDTVGEPSLPARTRLGTPGVDLGAFRPRSRPETVSRVRALAEGMAGQSRLGPDRQPRAAAAGSSFTRDATETANALSALADAAQSGPIVGFVGKLIVSKGIDLLLAAWPLVLAALPTASLAVVGFGEYRAAVERWIDALSRADLAAVQELVETGRGAEGGVRSSLSFARSFFEELGRSGELEPYLSAAAQMRDRVILTGRLEHPELGLVLPLCEAVVVPSTFPESFGMVVAEAAASGVLPISADHSGLAEVTRTLTGALPQPVRELARFPLGRGVVRSIAERVLAWLQAPSELRDAARTALPRAAAARYAWANIARDVIAASAGELESLEAPM
jgi:glycosyltransferase involved in cell wall biosynthesis